MSATSCLDCTPSSSPEPTALVGWVLETPGRGTLAIIITCLSTIFLCTWVVIHPRIYERELYAILHKFALFFKAILAPEFIAVEGLQEWAQCRRMRRDCAAYTDGDFKLIHAFYISMLALRYRTPLGDRVIWPNQYEWLLRQHLVDWKDHENWGLSVRNIRDKSKADSAAKLISLVQVSWFVAQSIMRTAHELPLAQLESMTISYIPLFAITYFFWWEKPKDIMTPSIIDLPPMTDEQRHTFESMSISNKFDNEGLEEQVALRNIWYLTPRVFEKEAEDRAIEEAREKALRRATGVTASHTTKSAIKAVHHSLTPEVFHGHGVSNTGNPSPEELRIELNKEKVLSHWDPDLFRSKLWPVMCLAGASFGALHLISWNTEFPTNIESWLWRISALVSIVSIIVFMHFEKVVLRWGGPLTWISIISPGLYFLSRIAMMGEVFAALRAEDPKLYDTYEVSTYWIHVL